MIPLLPLENSWAIEALLHSYNHVYQVAFDSSYQILDGIGVSYYGDAPVAAFQMEFHAFDSDPLVIASKIRAYPKHPNEKYVLNTFHADPSAADLKSQYDALGFDFVHTEAILGLPLPTKNPRGWTHIHKIESPEDIEFANKGLAVGDEHIPPATLGDAHIINFYAQLEHRAVGWAQLVTAHEGVGYINQLYTLPVFRQRGVGLRLLRRVHQEANHLGLQHALVLASEMGMSLFRRAGYQALAYLSVFRPRAEPA